MSDRPPGRRADAARRPSRARAGLRRIALRGMRFHALVGVLEHERRIPQPLEVDLVVWCSAAAGLVDYRELYEIVHRVTHAPIEYLEDAADAIATAALDDPRVLRARVALRKPHVALPGPLAHAEVMVDHARASDG